MHALATALAFTVATLLGMVHEASTTHVVCAEHGERIHGEAALASLHARVAAALERSHDPREAAAQLRGVRPIAGHASSDGHEHCTLSSALRESRVAAPPMVAPAPIAMVSSMMEPAARERARELRLYRTAPKTSPPA